MRDFNYLTLLVAACAALLIVGCDDKESSTSAPKPIAITYSLLDGCWQLAEWNGAPLAEGTFCYARFDRSEQRFEFYDNLATMYTRRTSGSFAVEHDDYDRYILSGTYDYGLGEWNNSYEVVAYYPADDMVWTTLDGVEHTRYVRIEAIPEEIIAEAREE